MSAFVQTWFGMKTLWTAWFYCMIFFRNVRTRHVEQAVDECVSVPLFICSPMQTQLLQQREGYVSQPFAAIFKDKHNVRLLDAKKHLHSNTQTDMLLAPSTLLCTHNLLLTVLNKPLNHLCWMEGWVEMSDGERRRPFGALAESHHDRIVFQS